MAVVGDKYVWKSGDGLWYIWEQMPEGYPPLKGDIGYVSKRKARIDARGPTPTAKHPTEEEMAEGTKRRKRTFLPLD